MDYSECCKHKSKKRTDPKKKEEKKDDPKKAPVGNSPAAIIPKLPASIQVLLYLPRKQ